MYSSCDDKSLFSSVKEGKKGAFRELYERYWESLYLQTKAMTSCNETAKDIVQEIFVDLWDKKESIEIQHSLKSYLFRITRNKVLNTYAHKKVHEKYIHSMAEYMSKSENKTDYLLRENLVRERIMFEIESLPNKMRQVFEMSRHEHKTYKEIADELQISDKTVKKQVSNALKILKEKLDIAYFNSLFILIHYFF